MKSLLLTVAIVTTIIAPARAQEDAEVGLAAKAYGAAVGDYMAFALGCEPVLGDAHVKFARMVAAEMMPLAEVDKVEADLRAEDLPARMSKIAIEDRLDFCNDSIFESTWAVRRAREALDAARTAAMSQ